MELSQEQELFLISCRAVTEEMIDKTVHNLRIRSEDEVHVMLLDDLYAAEANGLQPTQLMNALASAILLASIERKKGKA